MYFDQLFLHLNLKALYEVDITISFLDKKIEEPYDSFSHSFEIWHLLSGGTKLPSNSVKLQATVYLWDDILNYTT